MCDKYDIFANLNTKDCTYPLMNDKYEKIFYDGYLKTLNYSTYETKLGNNFIFPNKVWWILRYLEEPIIKKH